MSHGIFHVGDRVVVRLVRPDESTIRNGMSGTITGLSITGRIACVTQNNGLKIYPYTENLVHHAPCPMEVKNV